MSDKTEAMDNLIAQDADLIEICPNDLAQRLFIEADNFKVDREVGMRAMLYRAADCIEAQAAEIERLRVEARAQYDRGYYDGCTHPIVRHDALREALEAAPLIGATESAESFKARQDAWLNGQYRAALDQSK